MNKRRACLAAFWATAIAAVAPEAAAREWTVDANGCKVWNTQPAMKETVEWSGSCVDGLAEGKGLLRWTVNGQPTRTYEGDMKAGRRSGQGVDSSPFGSRYEGGFLDDARAGQGITRYHNGASAGGEHAAGRLTGACTLSWSDGTRYEGICRSERPEGAGKISFASGDHYAGALSFGRLSGQGRYQWAGGDSYEGGFAGGQAAGIGTYRFADGSRYEGEFKSGQPTGRGRLELADGEGYDGHFLDGIPASPGTFFKTGAAAPDDSPELRAKLNRQYAKPLPLRAVQPVTVAMICRKMTRPQLPVIPWKGMALFKGVGTVREGRIVSVEITPLRPVADPLALRAFAASIDAAMRSYDCPGNHVFEQEFQFNLT